MKLLEDEAKAWLGGRGLPVPKGRNAETVELAGEIAASLGGAAVVKALVAAGRRGKAGAVRLCADPDEVGAASRAMIGSMVAGEVVERVYVEATVDIADELYLAFTFGDRMPVVVASRTGGVDIEEAVARDAGSIQRREVDPIRGLTPWLAREIWEATGVASSLVPGLGTLTVELYRAFCAADALMLEINPLAVGPDGALSIVGTMMEIDDQAVRRHPQWADLASKAEGNLTAGERLVKQANDNFPGGAVRYSELDGDIGLMVAGGGAGLLQHDMIVDAGGRPANHSDISPTPTPDKPAAVFEAIFTNPTVRGLLIGYNYLQMAPCDLVIRALIGAMDKHGVDARSFPIVIRLFGPEEERARELAAGRPGIRYLPPDASLEEGCRTIVGLVNSQSGHGAGR